MMSTYKSSGNGSPSGNSGSNLEKRLRRHEAIEESLLMLVAETDRDRALSLLADTAARLIDAETLAVPMLSDDNMKVVYNIATGRHRDVFVGKELPIENAGLCGWVVENSRPITSNHLLDDPRVIKELAKALELNCALVVPLYSGGRITGGLSAFNKNDGSLFSEDDLRDLTLLSNYASVILDNLRLIGQLHSEKTKLEAILDGVNDGILFISPEGRILSANRATGRYLPMRAEDLTGADVRAFDIFKPLADVIGWREKARPGGRCWEVLACDQTACPSHTSDVLRCWHTSSEYCRDKASREGTASKLSATCVECEVFKDAALRLIEPRMVSIMGRYLKVSSTVVTGGEGGICGEIMVIHDYTAERQSERQRERFADMVTGDLKAPLTSISGYCELMAEEDDPEKLHDLNNAVRRNVSQVTRIIADYQEVLKATDERLELSPVPVRLQSLLPAMLVPHAAKAAESGVSFGWQVDMDTPEVMVDIDLLSRALAGLVENSLRVAEAGWVIRVSASKGPRGYARVELSDLGMTLPDEGLSGDFDWFFKCDDTDKGGAGGPGLCMVKAVVTAHGGSVSVRRGESGEAVFTLLLPAAVETVP